jgi:quercetin dioxygenase-like cupin family protein
MATARIHPLIPDSVDADPQHYKVEFENERVRVVRVRYGPGERSVMHSHPELVGIFLTDSHFKFTYPDGTVEEIHAKAGDIFPHEAFQHLPENGTETPFEAVLVELKRS